MNNLNTVAVTAPITLRIEDLETLDAPSAWGDAASWGLGYAGGLAAGAGAIAIGGAIGWGLSGGHR
ncbi:hypothetical protein [Amycolatopsis sp. NPDC059021]|uniref:hypothetical protein n=1 Tax=Amycolatopsis sp. NPDC059021 TaxID=3346704 RepID=UPI00366F4CBB